MENQCDMHQGARNRFHETTLLKQSWLSPKAFELEFSRPKEFHFTAGQSICFIYKNEEKYYSLASSPDDPTLSLCVRHLETGSFTPFLAEAPIGTRFQFSGPHGYFVFSPSTRPPVFVATGTGIAPFSAMARYGIRDFVILHGVSDFASLFYKDFLESCSKLYTPCISHEAVEDPSAHDCFHGRVTTYVRQHLPRAEYDFYLCGRREMTRDVIHLVDAFYPGSHVYTEVFF